MFEELLSELIKVHLLNPKIIINIILTSELIKVHLLNHKIIINVILTSELIKVHLLNPKIIMNISIMNISISLETISILIPFSLHSHFPFSFLPASHNPLSLMLENKNYSIELQMTTAQLKNAFFNLIFNTLFDIMPVVTSSITKVR